MPIPKDDELLISTARPRGASPLALRFFPEADREAFSAASSSTDKPDVAPRNAVGDRERTNARAIRRAVDRTLADA